MAFPRTPGTPAKSTQKSGHARALELIRREQGPQGAISSPTMHTATRLQASETTALHLGLGMGIHTDRFLILSCGSATCQRTPTAKPYEPQRPPEV